jgi:hypothetical protein
VHSNRQEINNTTSNQVQPLPIINASYANSQTGNLSKQNGYYLPRQHIRPLPFSNATASNAIAVNSNNLIINNNAKRNNVNQLAPLANRQNGVTTTSEVWTRPRIITIIRATEKPRSKISILLNRRAVYNYEQLVCDISNAFGLPQWRNDKIRKLYSLRGKRIQGIADFFRDEDTFLGVSGKEPLTGRLIKDILQDLYPDEAEQAASLFKEWEASRTARARPKHAISMEHMSKPDENGATTTASEDPIKKAISHSQHVHRHHHHQHQHHHNPPSNHAQYSHSRVGNQSNYNGEIDEYAKKKSM